MLTTFSAMQKNNCTGWCLIILRLKDKKFMKRLNHTFVTLILKKNHVIKLVDFRPIILCNVLYKLISKIIADTLKVLLRHIILETQSAFVPRKKIADNILIAYKILHFLKMKK